MRKRNKEVLFRMSPDEFEMFECQVLKSNLSKQKYLLALVFNNDIQPVHMNDDKSPVDTFTDKLK